MSRKSHIIWLLLIGMSVAGQPIPPLPHGMTNYVTGTNCDCDGSQSYAIQVWWNSGSQTNIVLGTDNLTNSFQPLIEYDNGETNAYFQGTNCFYFFKIESL